MSLLTIEDLAPPGEAAPEDSAALDYTHYPYIPRRWQGSDPVGSVVVYAAKGGMGKGMLHAAYAARTVLGLPFPGEDQAIRREPGRVVWISGPGEDDQFEDLAPRFRAAIAVAVAEFGLDPALAGEKGAIRFIHDLSVWPDDSPVTLPADCARVLAEVRKINNRAKRLGEPLVTRVVADSLSAVLSEGYTIDSRQGAVRVMVKLGLFARRADVAFPVLHHLTKDGQVAGSVGVLNSVRLAFMIEPAKDDETVRVITKHKSNIAEVPPLRYVITGDGPLSHAVFTDGQDVRTERVAAAEARAAVMPSPPPPGSLRARMASASASPAAVDAGPFRVLRRALRAGQMDADATQQVGGRVSTRAEARSLASQDAGRILDWHAGNVPGMEGAAFALADGTKVSYGVFPVRSQV